MQRGGHCADWKQGRAAGPGCRPYVFTSPRTSPRYRTVLTSPSPVITNAVYKNDAEALRRLQYRVQHHGDAPPAADSSSPAAPSYTQPPTPAANGYSMPNGYQNSASYPPYQQPPMPSRTPISLCNLRRTVQLRVTRTSVLLQG
jgi:hypothetical protein